MIISIRDGLGNQMFQYAFYEAKRKTVDIRCEDSYFMVENDRNYMLKIFPEVKIKYVPHIMSAFFWGTTFGIKILKIAGRLGCVYEENMMTGYDKVLETRKWGYIKGCFQDERYFKECEKDIRRIYRFNITDEELRKYIERVESENTVSIHIRRGDYLKFDSMFGGICTPEYYKNAITYVKTQIENPYFIVFSNEPEWARGNLKLDNALFINPNMFQHYEDWYDMCLMSHCHHNITANSTFSWWGAWLNEHPEKIVVCPERWENSTPNRKMVCAGWKEISGTCSLEYQA